MTLSKQIGPKSNFIQGSTLGLVLAFIAATCFALIAVVGKGLIARGLSPEQMMGIQMPIAFIGAYVLLFLAPRLWQIIARKPRPQNQTRPQNQNPTPEANWAVAGVMEGKMLLKLMVQGVIGTGGTIYFSYKALVYLPASLGSMLLFLYPVLVVLLFAIGGIKPMAWYNFIVVLAVAIGASLALDIYAYIALGTTLAWQGVVYGLLSALCYAIYHAIGEVWLKTLPSHLTTVYTLGFAALMSILLLALSPFFSGGSSLGDLINLTLEDWSLLTFVALVSNVLPVYLIYRAIQLIGADRVAVLSTLELPITLGLAMLMLGERLQWIQGLGVAVIVAAIFFLHKMEASH